MRVRLLFFATLKDIVGSRELLMDVPENCTVGELFALLESQFPRMKDYRSIALTALNEDYVGRDARISDGDEVAIFPPVSGGSR
jgi:molybdopterin synthase sulfur carrier subunit